MELNLVGTNIIVSHDDSSIVYNYKYYLRGNPNLNTSIYGPINRYFKTLDQSVLNKIYVVYDKLHRVLSKESNDLDLDIKELVELVQHYTAELYKNINFDHLRQWCLNQKDFYYHATLMDEYNGYRPETTYLKKDYSGLLFLCTLLKLMCPIWAYFNYEFMTLIGKDYKESISVCFLNQTGILEIEEYRKLEQMVYYISDKAVNTINAIFGNISSADLPTWALASILVRKIAIAEVNNPKVKIINVIYSHLSNLNKKNSLEDRGDSVRLKERKAPDESEGDEEDRDGVNDKYKLRQTHADHVPIIDEIYLSNFQRVVLNIDPDFPIDSSVYRPYINAMESLNFSGVKISDFHLKIIACVCHTSVFPRNHSNIQYRYFVNLLFATHLLLHYWGYKTVAHLIIASTDMIDEDQIKETSYVNLSPTIRTQLAQLYPHYRYTTKTNSNKNIELLNYGILFINDIVDNHINRYNWYYNNDHLIEDGGISGSLISIPLDIKTELAQLLLDRVSRPVPKSQLSNTSWNV